MPDISAEDTLTVQLSSGRTFTLPFLDAVLDLRELAEKHPGQGTEFLCAVQEFICEKTAEKLTRGEACNLYEQLELAHARKKKAYSNAMRDAYGLPPPTESTPGDSPPTS